MTLTLGLYLSIAVAGWLTFGSLQGREAGSGTRRFAVFGGVIGCWSVGELLILSAGTAEELILARRVFFFSFVLHHVP